MTNVSVTVTGGKTSYLYGSFTEIDERVTRDSIVHIAGGTHTDVSPLRLPRELVIGKDTTITIAE